MPPPIVALASNTVPPVTKRAAADDSIVSLVRMIGVLLDPECSPIIEEQLILACDFRASGAERAGAHGGVGF
jgi:hypothetical protein